MEKGENFVVNETEETVATPMMKRTSTEVEYKNMTSRYIQSMPEIQDIKKADVDVARPQFLCYSELLKTGDAEPTVELNFGKSWKELSQKERYNFEVEYAIRWIDYSLLQTLREINSLNLIVKHLKKSYEKVKIEYLRQIRLFNLMGNSPEVEPAQKASLSRTISLTLLNLRKIEEKIKSMLNLQHMLTNACEYLDYDHNSYESLKWYMKDNDMLFDEFMKTL